MDNAYINNVTAYCPNGRNLLFSIIYKTSPLVKIGHVFPSYSYIAEYCGGTVEVVEISEDYKEIWLEYYNAN